MTTSHKEKLMIIDGNALIHRSFHALPLTLTTKKGELVNAVYGFAAVLLKAIREFRPDYLVLTLDKKGPTFRHKEFADYKATRQAAPNELYQQIPRVKEIAEALAIPVFELRGVEADDLIGTIAARVDGGVEKIIVTGDLDTLQLVDGSTKVFTMKRGLTDSMIYDQQAVRQRYGLEPKQLIDFKALRGDPSDNIPGVKGIGEKTALELLKNYKTLDNVYKNIASPKIKERTRELLKQHRPEALMSRKLATIKRDVKLPFKLETARFSALNQEPVARLFSQLEFKSLLPRLQTIGQQQLKTAAGRTGRTEQTSAAAEDKFSRDKKLFNYQLIDSDQKFNKFLIKLKQCRQFTFDSETDGADVIEARLLGISFSWQPGTAYYLQLDGGAAVKPEQNNLFNYQSGSAQEPKQFSHPWLEKLKPIFKNDKIKKFGHNLKFDIEVLAANGLAVKGAAGDTMIASYLLNPGSRQHNLDALTFVELGFQKITKQDLLGQGREKIGFSQAALDKLYLYSCEDADFTNRLVRQLLPQLKEQKLIKLFETIEMPLIEVLVKMELAGVKIDVNLLAKISKNTSKKINQLASKIYRLAGGKFNINSTQQLRQILYQKLGLSTVGISKTKTGLSTGADELAKLKDQHAIIKLLQEYRELNKLQTTYLEALPRLVNKHSQRLHTSFNQAVTATGRLSSTEPNLQNIPVRTELGRAIRRAFIAERGYRLVSFDYSQIELRLAAHMSGDQKMIKAFRDGADIHTATAAEINQVAPQTVDKEMRRQAKAINFGILYGQGPHGLSQYADIPFARAREFIEQYFTVYSGVKDFIDQTIERARRRGYAETLLGRRRYLPEINSSVLQARKAAERIAINMPLQGTAADLIKAAMIEINQQIITEQFATSHSGVRPLLQVHDELLFEVKDNQVKQAARQIKEIMEKAIKLKVPVIVDVSAGKNWGELEEIK